MFEDLLQNAEIAGDRVAVEHDGRRINYAELAHAARRFAGGLRAMGVMPGDTIGIMMPNAIEWPIALYGASMNGNVVVPLNIMLTSRELAHILDHTSVRLLVVGELVANVARAAIAGLVTPPVLSLVGAPGSDRTSFAALLDHEPLALLSASGDERHALTIFTSGTTGVAKGAVLTVGNLRAQVDMIIRAFGPAEGDRVLCPLPLFHAFGLNGVLQVAMRYRGPVVLQSKFDVRATVAALSAGDVAWFAGVPTMYAYLVAAMPEGAKSGAGLRYCVCGGAPLSPSLAAEFERRFGASIFQGYGLTETVFAVCCNRPGPGGRKDGAVGRALDGVTLRVLDDAGRELPQGATGEIVVSGGVVMRGYWKAAEATGEILRDGWLHTGDIGYVDQDGFCFLVDRKRDLIIKGGYNIYPKEVEDALSELPGVKEVAVVGVADSVKGEHVCAVVAVNADAGVGEPELRAHLFDRLAKYKHPNLYRFVEALPRGATGKILKERVRRALVVNERMKGDAAS
jgi:long-chain acyl-CoA synthetase